MAAVSRGTSHATTKQHCLYTTLADIKNKKTKNKNALQAKRRIAFDMSAELRRCVKVEVDVLGSRP